MSVQALLDRLMVVYGEPKTHDLKAWAEEYTRQLAGFGSHHWDKAADHLFRHHRIKSWPTPGEIIAAWEAVSPRPHLAEGPKHSDWTEAAIARADRMIQSDMGREAAQEGWITGLHDHCRRNHVMPTPREVASLKRAAREFEEAYAIACRGDCGELSRRLVELGDSALARRERLARIAMR